MFDVTLAGPDVGPSLASARAQLERTLSDVETLAPLVLGAKDAAFTATFCREVRACGDELARRIVDPQALLTSDELVGANRTRLDSGLRGLLARFAALTLTATNLAHELRKQVRFRASA